MLIVPARRPTGYTLLAVFLALAALGDAATLVFGSDPARGVGPAAWRLVNVLDLALSAVLAEALWKMRPWVSRVAKAWAAVQAWRLAYPVAAALLAGTPESSGPVVAALISALFGAFVLWLVVGYVLRRASTLFPPPIPRPVP